MHEEHLKHIDQFLPKYLSPRAKESLFSNLKKNFPNSDDPNRLYKRLKDITTYYQGDGILDIPFSVLNTKNKCFDIKYFKGAILSNTCDISTDNRREYKPFVNIAAIYDLKDFTKYLKEQRVSEDKIKVFLKNLRANILSSLFYLPKLEVSGEVIMAESFIRFDHTTCLPIDFINEDKYDKQYQSLGGDRIYTFSNYGFYLFLFKLSVHYCRIREGVFRD